MASATENHDPQHHPFGNFCGFVQSTATNLSAFLTSKPTPSSPSPSSNVYAPLIFSDHRPQTLYFTLASPFESTQSDSSSPSRESRTPPSSTSSFPSRVRISSLTSAEKDSGPAFVGQVFTICDPSGTGITATPNHFDMSFFSKRIPEWIKKMFPKREEKNHQVCRFFMDVGDAVSYVKRLNIPIGVVGSCRLDLAYAHFKEKPHRFCFIPNEKQVKEANKLLKRMPHNGGKKKVDGVPVFSAKNLDIAVATAEGIKWYTPYFFDKSMLDDILEESVDARCQLLIQERRVQRRRDIIDDNLTAEASEDMGDAVWDPPEVQEVLNEVGHPGIPLSVISKAAELELLYAVDKVLLGNRWLRKVTGIQPKFPYMVDSFEKRTAASLSKAHRSSNSSQIQCLDTSKDKSEYDVKPDQGRKLDFPFPFADWWTCLLPKEQQEKQREEHGMQDCRTSELKHSPFHEKITMFGIFMGEGRTVSKATLKKTMADLTKELEKIEQENIAGSCSSEFKDEERDPLFFGNVGDYHRGVARMHSTRWF